MLGKKRNDMRNSLDALNAARLLISLLRRQTEARKVIRPTAYQRADPFYNPPTQKERKKGRCREGR